MACSAQQARPLPGCPGAHFRQLNASVRKGLSTPAPAGATCHRQQALPCAIPQAIPAVAEHAVHALQTKQPLQLHRRLQPQHQAHLPWRPSGVDHTAAHGLSRSCRAAASSQAFAADDDSGRSSSSDSSKSGVFAAAASLARGLSDTAADLQELIQRFLSLWRQFLPMLSLFFCLSFINTILDSLKDTLVITAAGGGAFVIPYLTVYAVLPMSMVFLVAFSAASQRMSRSALFNSIVAIFVAFFGGFALFLYPNADILHPHALADQLQQVLPQGLTGLVGMVRNWTFTLFFCMSELWGDVCMGLLFWGLANEITNLSDAATLYPLFGLGANLAQALAGMVLKATTRGGATEFASALQASMAAVVGIACVAIMLQQHITNQAEAAAAAQRHRHLHRHNSSTMASAADLSRAASPGNTAASAAAPTQTQQQQQDEGQASKQQTSLRESFKVLAASVEIRCLAVMSLAQGLCNSLMEFAWKCHMRLLYPSPADFTAFLGDVATWSGVVTGGLMLLSPLLFERLGWRGVAGATPKILLFGGSAFFCACIAYQHFFGHVVAASGASAAGPAGIALLQGLVIFGALLYVFGRGAKFSLFKPAEEMVYITLDEDGRTRGKAAIDVVGSQSGKSVGSLLQQALLITSAGSIVGIMPVLFAVFFAMLRGWRSAVHTLSSVRHYSYDSPISSLEEDEGDAQPPQAILAAAAAAPAVGSGSSSSLQPADQQELLEQLQKLADDNDSSNGGDVSSSKSHSQGSKAFRDAVARSSTSSSSSSSSSSTGESSSNGIAEGDAPSSIDGSHSRNGVSSNGLKAQERNPEVITLSHDAARAFRQNRRDAAGGPGHGSVDDGGSASSSPSEDAGSVSSRVSQGGDGGNA